MEPRKVAAKLLIRERKMALKLVLTALNPTATSLSQETDKLKMATNLRKVLK